ncbi:DUF11 domain-containing protein, partial [Lacihabitans sp. LS3-19]|nr:DUF11 domain-containing protein [Lacihabitans sp. LS3-19]
KVVDQTTIAAPGTLNYTITVTNEGNTDLHGVTVADAKATTLSAETESVSTNGTLNVGEVWTYTATYIVTQAEIDNGTAIENIAMVTTTELPVAKADTVNTTIIANPELSITKIASDTSLVFEGQIVTYTYLVTNIGNVSVKDVSVTDIHSGSNPLSLIQLQSTNGTDNGLDNLVDSLAPNQQAIWTSTYIVTAQDIINSVDIVNTATASGTPISGILINPSAIEIITVGEFLVAVNDTSSNNPVGVPVVINIIANDSLSSGFNPNATQVSVDLNPSLPGIQDTLIV